jgi:8-oxo-dGTP pyrophosphatase MutT (NUDIX family)
MLYYSKPKDFAAKFEVGLCIVKNEDKILLLQRQEGKGESGLWGIPGGKINSNETSFEGAQRELLEETGLDLSSYAFLSLGILYDIYPDFSFIVHMFSVEVTTKNITINTNEHKEYKWVSFDEALIMDLMQDVDEILQYVYSKKSQQPEGTRTLLASKNNDQAK